MTEYERLTRKGYIPIKEYKRFILFVYLGNINLRRCILKVDIKPKEAKEIFEGIDRWEDGKRLSKENII